MNWLTANRNRVAAKTTNRRLTSLRQFAKWARWPATFEEYSAPTPLRGIPHPLPEGMAGVRAMIDVCKNERHQALIALCGFCGTRVSEALAVRPSDINIVDMMLRIRGKGDKERWVPISPEAWEYLQKPMLRAITSGQTTIVGMQDRAARAMVTRVAEKANLRRAVSSHDLRATFATAVYDNTKDQRLVQLLLGHASGTTTEIYIGRTSNQLKEAVVL